MKQQRSPFAWILLFILIGIVTMLSKSIAPEGLPVQAYGVRDFLRADNLVVLRLPNTTKSEGLISVTEDSLLIPTDRIAEIRLSSMDFNTIMTFRTRWCQKPSDTQQTVKYVVGLRCQGFTRQFEFSRDQLPPEMLLMLRLTQVAPDQ
jgi:hypothetical protein